MKQRLRRIYNRLGPRNRQRVRLGLWFTLHDDDSGMSRIHKARSVEDPHSLQDAKEIHPVRPLQDATVTPPFQLSPCHGAGAFWRFAKGAVNKISRTVFWSIRNSGHDKILGTCTAGPIHTSWMTTGIGGCIVHYDNGEPGGVFLDIGRATLTESDEVEHAEPVFLRSGRQGSWDEAFVADPFVLRMPQ